MIHEYRNNRHYELRENTGKAKILLNSSTFSVEVFSSFTYDKSNKIEKSRLTHVHVL